MDIYERIKQDHDKQRMLCDAVAKTEGASEDRKKHYKYLRTELMAHAAAEEQVFYSRLMKDPDGTDDTRHGVHEHQVMDEIIEELDEMDMSSPGWITRFKTLQEKVLHHLKDEEEDFFDRAREIISDEDAKKMVAEFNKRKPAEELSELKDYAAA